MHYETLEAWTLVATLDVASVVDRTEAAILNISANAENDRNRA